jgi:putrescine aminotransferase
MSAVAGHDFVIVSGEGSHVRSESGEEYLDATAALWYCNVGYGRAEIVAAVAEQMGRLASYTNFGDFATRPTLDLADRLAGIAPMPDAKVFFTSGGSDAVDTALKLVRRYFDIVGEPDRRTVITRTKAYHGMHLAGTSLAGIEANRAGYGALDPDVAQVQWDNADALAERIDEIGSRRVAAFFCEPVIGAGGVFMPPAGYLAAVRDICRERGVLFIADEVITGYGRTGRMFASAGLDPDIVLTAKGLTSGYLPMGAVFVGSRVAEPFWTTPGLVWRHGYTYSGHAAAAAAAMSNLDIIEREGLVQRVADSQLSLAAALSPLRSHSFVSEVRSGSGLLAAVQLDHEVVASDATVVPRLVTEVRRRGVLTRQLVDGALQISPPFVITRDEMRILGSAIDEALTEVGSSRSATAELGSSLLPDITDDELGGFGTSDERLLADVPPHHGA